MVVVVLALAACGSSAPKHAKDTKKEAAGPVICRPQAREAMAGLLTAPATSISAVKGTGNNADPQCTFATKLPDGRRVSAVVNVDSGPEPYFVLERTEIENSQVFGPQRMEAAPQAITRVGLMADWFPAHTQLMATDGVRLITTTVTWHGVKQGRRIALARVMTVPYLKLTKRGQAAAKGYPSG